VGRRYLITIIAFVLFAVGGLKAASIWEKKPFNTWTDAELNTLLTGSPWAGPGSIVRIKPDGTTARMNDNVTVSWTTALPMRQAVARERIGLNGAVSKEVESFLASPVDSFIVAVKVTGSSEAQSLAALAGQAQLMTRLEPRDKIAIVALRGEGYVLDGEGRLVTDAAGVGAKGSKVGENAGSLLVFAFPRTAISARDREVEFTSQIGGYAIRRTFHVNEMIYNGKLEL
jgi:hypothetical protein